MGLTARPSKNIDLSKIDDIQDEIFGEDPPPVPIAKEPKNTRIAARREEAPPPATSSVATTPALAPERTPDLPVSTTADATQGDASEPTGDPIADVQPIKNVRAKTGKRVERAVSAQTPSSGNTAAGSEQPPSPDQSIADLLSTAKVQGVRYTTRPYTVPRSLTIDLTRLKSIFRSRDLQYTQAELMEKMLKESLEIVTAENYLEMREKGLGAIKSPDQCSRRSVTLTEDTFFSMSELKAELAQAHGRRYSNDDLLTMLLAVAFAPLYEQGLL